jgi:hypothetical protein
VVEALGEDDAAFGEVVAPAVRGVGVSEDGGGGEPVGERSGVVAGVVRVVGEAVA